MASVRPTSPPNEAHEVKADRVIESHKLIGVGWRGRQAALCAACRAGDLPAVSAALSAGADPLEAALDGYAPPLALAARGGSLPVTQVLWRAVPVETRPMVWVEPQYPLFGLACGSGSVELVEWMLAQEECREAAGFVDWRGQTALHVAANAGLVEVVRLLLALPDVEVQSWSPFDRQGRHPVHLAVQSMSVATVRLLVERHESSRTLLPDEVSQLLNIAARNLDLKMLRYLFGRASQESGVDCHDIALNCFSICADTSYHSETAAEALRWLAAQSFAVRARGTLTGLPLCPLSMSLARHLRLVQHAQLANIVRHYSLASRVAREKPQPNVFEDPEDRRVAAQRERLKVVGRVPNLVWRAAEAMLC